MKFSAVVEQVLALLQRQGRVSSRMLKREFDLDDDILADLKEELLYSHAQQVREEGPGLVWVGEQAVVSNQHSVVSSPSISNPQSLTPNPQPPIAYTPAHLADRIRATTVTEGERKTITAVFADLKGSTALIEGLDPEEARTVIDPALQLMMDAVHQYDGYVAQALGDGIFALFGAPLAHEDHPQRAVYAALRMQDAMHRYGDTLRQKGYPPLLMRVGLNTGEVVLRSIRKDDLHADYVPVGHSTNLAARMEQLATPGSIVVSAYTHRLTDGYFAFKDLGPTQIKGVEEPLHIYEVLGVGQLRTRLQVSASRYGLTRFVGRQREMEQLNNALAQAKAGHGQIVGVMGEPGLGKSRLFHEFKLLSLGGCLVLEAYSVSHGKATAYLPVIELLKSYFRIESQDDERTRREKVTGKVLNLDRNLEDTLPYLFALLGIEEQPSPLAQMDPQIRRRRTFEALKKLFLRESLNQPLILIFEDLHWIDGETQGFLDVLSESVASARLLLLTNYRPEYRHEWGQKTYYSQLRLAPFGPAEAEEFLDSLLGSATAVESPLPRGERARERVTENNLHALKQLILDKTQGTPFFMEEIVQELVEQGVLVRDGVGAGLVPAHTGRPQGSPLQIPTTVQAVLAARIDRLAPDEKALLQQLAVIGRQFPLSLIRQIITQPEAELYRLLASLQHKEFLYEQPAFPESEYIFKHALTQDVAYGTVLQEQKKLLHKRTGQVLEHLYTDTLEEHYGELAHHYQRSGNTEKAIEYLQKAGQQALQRSANTEAVSHLRTALVLLKTLPDTPARQHQELHLQVTLGPALFAAKGYSAPETEQVFMRAWALCQQLGETTLLPYVLGGLCILQGARGNWQNARQVAEERLRLASSTQEPTTLVEAHSTCGHMYSWAGDFPAGRSHLEQSLTLYEALPGQSRLYYLGWEIGVFSRALLSVGLWYLGYPEQALRRQHEALTLAHDLSHPYSLAHALVFAADLFRYRGDGHAVQQWAESAIAVCTAHEFAFYLGWSTVQRGWALVVQGHGEEGVRQIEESLAAWRRASPGATLWPILLATQTDAYALTGQVAAGLRAVEEELTRDKREESWCDAEFYRLKGELTLQLKTSHEQVEDKPRTSRSTSEAEVCFLKAIEIAQRQQAKSWELRAAVSLARLWQSQGKNTEARDLLAPVYNWFTEGFDTKDLQEAKVLLDELATTPLS